MILFSYKVKYPPAETNLQMDMMIVNTYSLPGYILYHRLTAQFLLVMFAIYVYIYIYW